LRSLLPSLRPPRHQHTSPAVPATLHPPAPPCLQFPAGRRPFSPGSVSAPLWRLHCTAFAARPCRSVPHPILSTMSTEPSFYTCSPIILWYYIPVWGIMRPRSLTYCSRVRRGWQPGGRRHGGRLRPHRRAWPRLTGGFCPRVASNPLAKTDQPRHPALSQTQSNHFAPTCSQLQQIAPRRTR